MDNLHLVVGIPGYRIRRAREDDLPRVSAIERAAALRFASYGLAEVLSGLSTPREALTGGIDTGGLLVAEHEVDGVVGWALALELDGHGHLEEVDVLVEHGKHGLGRALVDAVIAWSRVRGYTTLTLSAQLHIPWNAPFYAHMGFRVVPAAELSPALAALLRYEASYGLPMENRVIMELALSPLAEAVAAAM